MKNSDKVVLVIEDKDLNMKLVTPICSKCTVTTFCKPTMECRAGNLRESVGQISFSWTSNCQISPDWK